MSEIFEALRRAQENADTQGAASPASNAPETSSTPADGRDAVVEEAAAVPPARPRVRRPRRRSATRWLLPGRGRDAARNGQTPDRVLVSAAHGTETSEQFRMLRTRIELAGPGILLVTSALEWEGKTLCAVNLGVSLSMGLRAKVLLVETDLRRPALQSYFDLRGKPGLVNCLTGQAGWQECIHATGFEGFRVLPAGRHTEMAPELLGSERMAAVAAELKSAFPQHHILFDAPPILLTADPLIMARHVDHVLLVIRAGLTPRSAVYKAIETLGHDRFLGVVFNGAPRSVSHYYQYGYKRYATYYRSDAGNGRGDSQR